MVSSLSGKLLLDNEYEEHALAHKEFTYYE